MAPGSPADPLTSRSASSRLPMNLLKSVENTIANLVEGAFGRAFRSEVRPMELARKLAREMDAHRTVSVSRVYVPNEYSVWLSPEDRDRYEGVEARGDRRAVRLPARARPPRGPDPRLAVRDRLPHRRAPDARRVRHPGAVGPPAGRAARRGAPQRRPPRSSRGARQDDDLQHLRARARAGRGGARAARARRGRCSRVGGRRLLVPAARAASIGRSRDCDVVLDDAGISRRHAEIAPGGRRLDDRRPRLDQRRARQRPRDPRRAARCAPGDRIELGSTEIVFELG